MNLCDIKTIKQLMAMFSLNFRKEFGQNFLTDSFTVEDIADSCSTSPEATILEIGPGAGTLTQQLAKRYKQVVAVEIDNGLIPLLRYTLNDFHNVKVVNADIMKTDIGELLSDSFASGPVCVCANLPYYITTPIMMMLLESGLPFESITVMMQTEVADRLCASAGNKAYGAITAVLNYYAYAEKLFTVTSDKFIPEPKVDSTVIKVTLHKQKPYIPLDEATLFRTIRAAFEQRRKTLPNAISAVFGELPKETITKIITENCSLPADIRGERLDISQFVNLSDELFRAISN